MIVFRVPVLKPEELSSAAAFVEGEAVELEAVVEVAGVADTIVDAAWVDVANVEGADVVGASSEPTDCTMLMNKLSGFVVVPWAIAGTANTHTSASNVDIMAVIT